MQNILAINSLALDLVARDFSNGHSPSNGGPTKTSRALAIIHLAARDAYAKITGDFAPKLPTLPNPPTLDPNDTNGSSAMIGAGIRTAMLLYPDDIPYITTQIPALIASADPIALSYGFQVADAWIKARSTDHSDLPQLDTNYKNGVGHHRPDPLNSQQQTLGREWGKVTPFILNNIATDTSLSPPPALTDVEYAAAFDQVYQEGRNNLPKHSPHKAAIGIFWGYDGSNKLGTPPRLYNQVVIASTEFQNLSHPNQINVLAAINAAMADAGIAAWYWKYIYDLWRPVIGIREADAGWGPTGKGDQNTHRNKKGDPFWLPLGAPKSNPDPNPKTPTTDASRSNFTPNFPAYPSGHATFGSACFETFAALIGKKTSEITIKFVSDEFNGTTTDNQGILRPKWEQTFTLDEAIEQNKISRIYLGVHWIFDATGGEAVGKQVAEKAVLAFK